MVAGIHQLEVRVMVGVRGKPRPPVNAQAALIGEALRERRTSSAVNKRQEDVALDAAVSQKLVSQIERGEQDLRTSGLNTILGLLRALKWTLADLQKVTGLDLGISDPATDAQLRNVGAMNSPEPKTVAASLLEAADLYGQRFPDLREQTWQNYLNSFRPHGAVADTPEEWLDLYRDLIKHGITPIGK